MPAIPDAAQQALESALGFLDRAIHEAGEKQIAEFLFAEFVRFDVPLIPEAVESVTIDPFMRSVIERLVAQIHAKVHRDPAPTT